jgi:hypothetical protein
MGFLTIGQADGVAMLVPGAGCAHTAAALASRIRPITFRIDPLLNFVIALPLIDGRSRQNIVIIPVEFEERE